MDNSLYPRPGECLRCYRTIFATLPVRPNRAYPTQMLQNSTDDEEGKEASGFTQNKTLSSIQTEPSVFLCIKRADALPHRLFSYLFLSLPLQLRGYGLLRRACKLRLRRFCGPDRRYLRSIPDLFYPQQNNAFSRRGTYCS